ncbi:MAG: hypothetical protein EOO60_07120 [Hymenobacter sp.]|nr:MAG: hypothetical protein EOO60_07120 [Hymenobacter sp.]
MKKVVAKTYSVDNIADIYLAALAKGAIEDKNYLLPDILREQKIYYDEGIVTGVIQLLEDRKYITGTGKAYSYTIFKPSSEAREVIMSTIEDYVLADSRPKNVDFTLMLRYYEITAAGARFVRLGQTLDIQGKIEHEAARKKRMERFINSAIALATTIFAMVVKSMFFEK